MFGLTEGGQTVPRPYTDRDLVGGGCEGVLGECGACGGIGTSHTNQDLDEVIATSLVLREGVVLQVAMEVLCKWGRD